MQKYTRTPEGEIEFQYSEQESRELTTLRTGIPEVLDDERGEEALLGRIPLLSGSANKAQFLGYRSMGFSTRESARLADIRETTIRKWRREDPEFRDFESHYIPSLQKSIASDLLRMEFMRNFKLALKRDFDVLFKAACDLDTLTDREFEYLKKVRALYTPMDILNLDRAVQPEISGDTFTASLTVTVGKNEVDSEQARRAAARSLLDKFRVNAQVSFEGSNGAGERADEDIDSEP